MLYFDYAANTPACAEALETFCQVTRDFIANPNSAHPLGEAARARLAEATEQTASLLGVKPEEIIFTSGASEANNLAIKGAAGQYRARGKRFRVMTASGSTARRNPFRLFSASVSQGSAGSSFRRPWRKKACAFLPNRRAVRPILRRDRSMRLQKTAVRLSQRSESA